MNALAYLIAGYVIGYAIGKLLMSNPPKRLRAWWHSLDALPCASRKQLYIALAMTVLGMALLNCLTVLSASRREDALEARTRQCEDRQKSADGNHGDGGDANPHRQAVAFPPSINAKGVSEQPAPESGHDKPQADTANLVLSRSLDSYRNDHRDQVTRQFGSTHRNPLPNQPAPSIAQGGAA